MAFVYFYVIINNLYKPLFYVPLKYSKHLFNLNYKVNVMRIQSDPKLIKFSETYFFLNFLLELLFRLTS